MRIILNQDTLSIVFQLLRDIITSGQVLQQRITEEDITPENVAEVISSADGTCEGWLLDMLVERASRLWLSVLEPDERTEVMKETGCTWEELTTNEPVLKDSTVSMLEELLKELEDLSDSIPDGEQAKIG